MTKSTGRTRRALLGGGLAAIGASAAVAQSAPGRGASGTGAAAATDLRPGTEQDQTPALQRAMTAAAREQRPVHLPPGRFRVGALTLPSGTRLIGAGAGATVLVQANTQPVLVARGGGPVAVQDLSVEGNPAASRTTPLVS